MGIYNAHGGTKLGNGKYEFLIDTRAASDLTGAWFPDLALKPSKEHLGLGGYGYSGVLPKAFNGVGSGGSTCSKICDIWQRTEDGMPFQYVADVIDDVPGGAQYRTLALYGMPSLRRINAFVGCRRDELIIVPPGIEIEVIWPKGTRILPCERSPAGHMMLVMSHWDRMKSKEEMIRELDLREAKAKRV